MLFRAQMAEGSSAYEHAVKIIGYIEKLATLEFVMDQELSIDLILQSSPEGYAQFALNYIMNKNQTSISELINLLKTVEPTVK